jgi:hypothetical protein
VARPLGLRADRATVDVNGVARSYPRADSRGCSVHRHAAGADPVFDFAAGAEPGLRQRFLEFLGAAHGRLPGVPMHICNSR